MAKLNIQLINSHFIKIEKRDVYGHSYSSHWSWDWKKKEQEGNAELHINDELLLVTPI